MWKARPNKPNRPMIAWLILGGTLVVVAVVYVVSPRLWPSPFPLPLDYVLVVFTVLAAFVAGLFRPSGILFLLFGLGASVLFFVPTLLSAGWGVGTGRYHGGCDMRIVLETCTLTVGLGVACRLAASLAHWLTQLRPYDPRYCRNCGYDLTGNVSGRCPECGTEITASD